MKREEFLNEMETQMANMVEDYNNERRFLKSHHYDYDLFRYAEQLQRTMSAMKVAMEEIERLTKIENE